MIILRHIVEIPFQFLDWEDSDFMDKMRIGPLSARDHVINKKWGCENDFAKGSVQAWEEFLKQSSETYSTTDPPKIKDMECDKDLQKDFFEKEVT